MPKEARTRSARKLNYNADLKASNTNVVQQAKLMDSAGTAWHAVKYGNLELIMKLFPSQCNVYNKGPVGENVFHVAMLLNTPSTLAIAKYLVKLYGSMLVNTPYQERKHEEDVPGQYEGETALHIAIVNKDFDMVKFLVQNSADVHARAYGEFFREGSVVYYGEYPLSFAACTGQKDIVSYLKRHGARVNGDKDTSGNTALHMCVYYEQTDMYDHLVEYCGASEHIRNNRGQTPLLLAASLGKQEIFQHIYNKRRRVAWAYGPVTSYSLSLHEIDTVQTTTRSFVPSALEQVVRRAHIFILNDPLIKTLLDAKWSRFAMVGFVAQMLLYTIFVVLQAFLIWVHSDALLWNTSSRLALEVVTVIFACAFILLEVVDVVTWTAGVYNMRRFMKSNAMHVPPLYPIPGDGTGEQKLKQPQSLISRMMKGAISEGIESGGKDLARLQNRTSGPGPSEGPASAQLSLTTSPLSSPYRGGLQNSAGSFLADRPAYACSSDEVSGSTPRIEEARGLTAAAASKTSTQSAVGLVAEGTQHPSISANAPVDTGPRRAAGPVAEGKESGGQTAAAASKTSKQHAAGPVAEVTQRPSSSAEAPRAEGSGVEAEGTQRAAGVGTEGSHPAPTSDTLPCVVVSLGSIPLDGQQWLPMGSDSYRSGMGYIISVPSVAEGDLPSMGSNGVTLAHHTSSAESAPHSTCSLNVRPPSWNQSQGPIIDPNSLHGCTYSPYYTQGSLDFDIVSVGLTGGGDQTLPSLLPSFMPHAPQSGITSMLGGSSLRPLIDSNPHHQDMANKRGGPSESLLGISFPNSHHLGNATTATNTGMATRVPTFEIGSTADAHTLAAAASAAEADHNAAEIKNRPRGGTVRKVTSAKDEHGNGGDDDRQPLHAGGFVGCARTTLHATHGYYVRMLRDPIMFVVYLHLLLTLVHFITWACCYGGVDGSGPSNEGTKQFDDIVLSLVGLTGWGSMMYFARGLRSMGQMHAIMECCMMDMIKFTTVFFLADMSFTLAFYTLLNGTTYVTDVSSFTPKLDAPFSNIGYGIIQIIRFLYGQASYEFYTDTNCRSKLAFATIYFILYVFGIVLMLSYLLIAMILHTFNSVYSQAEDVWRLRWASYVLRMERRMPLSMQQQFRLGEVSYDPQLQARIYNHVFEVVDGAKEATTGDQQVKALEALLEKVKQGRRKGK